VLLPSYAVANRETVAYKNLDMVRLVHIHGCLFLAWQFTLLFERELGIRQVVYYGRALTLNNVD